MPSKKRRSTRGKHPLRELREALDMKPAAMGDAIGRTRSFISMVEARDTDLGRESVIALFDRFRPTLNQLGITAEDLLRGTRIVREDNSRPAA